jgi:Neurotransmitter-gated ion-channel ligand binding domain/Neurotransmitter-gated ion-channel transmembrane region
MRQPLILIIALLVFSLLIPFDFLHGQEKKAATIKAEAEDVVTAPKTERGKATEIFVNLAVLDISNIHDKEQKITIDLGLRLTWKDPRLAKKVGKDDMRAKMEDVWTPNIQILNDIGLQKKMAEAVEVQSDGTVTYRQRYVGDISERFNLRKFPRDKQNFEIRFGVSGETENTIKFKQGKVLYFPVNEDVTVEDWWFTPGTLSTKPLTFKGFKSKTPGFTYTFEGKRRIGFYVWTLIVPLVVIVFMSWAVFWLDPQPELFGPQIGIATTSMLTVVAFRFILVSFIPNVAYMTRMDKFLLGALVLVFLSLVEVIVTSDLAKRKKMEMALRVDLISRWCFPIVFAAMLYYSFWL